MSDYSVINKYVPRADSLNKAVGKAKYGADLFFENMLYGYILRSSLAHAKIVDIDISKVKKLPGVKVILTGKDLPYHFGLSIEDEPFLAIDVVRYIGEPVVAIAVDNEDIAEEVLDLIKVRYEELPAVFDAKQAMQEGAPIIHPDFKSYKSGDHSLFTSSEPRLNICSHFKVRKGKEIEKAFKEAEYIFEHTFTTPTMQACTIEPSVCTALVSNSEDIIIWASTQSAYRLRDTLSSAMDIPLNKFRIIIPEIGGAFGHRVGAGIESLTVALAIHAKNRPIRMNFNREDELCHFKVRHASNITIKSGVNRNGEIIARKAYIIMDTGAYAKGGPTVCRASGHTSLGPYEIPNVHIDAFCIYSNKVPASGLRAYGTPQVGWAYETHTDIIAQELGFDPVSFRKVNLLRFGGHAATGERIINIALDRCLEKATKEIQWDEKKYTNRKKAGSKRRGVGVSCIQKATTGPSASTTLIKMDQDASVTIITSTVEMGQGSNTALALIAAEILSLPLNQIFVTTPDTDYTPFDAITSSSRATFTSGNAVKNAAIDLRNQLLEMAKNLLKESDTKALSLKSGVIESRNSGKSISLDKIMKSGFYGKLGGLVGRGSFYSNYVMPMDKETGLTEKASAFWMYAAHCAEVEVDINTGKVSVLKVTAAHDVGRAINRLGCEQQIEGSVIFGLGHALYEEIKFEKGKVLNRTLTDYKIPTSMDIPEIIPIIVEDAPDEIGPFGAKGIGEPGVIAIIPAIGNAIFDAVGVRIKDLPCSPEKILLALKNEIK